MKEQLFLEQPRRGKTHEVQVTPHKRNAVWGISDQRNAVWGISDQRSAVWIRLIPALLFLLILAAAPAYAQDRNDRNNANDHSQIARETHVTATEAMNVGYTFMRTGTGTRGGGTRGSDVRKQAMQLIYTGQAYDSLTGITTDCYYVFALQPKGFVIVAADDRVEPILGYSYDNDFVVANMPDHVRGWFGSYEKQIEAVVKKDIASEAETTAKWSRLKAGQAMSTRSGGTVGPLLTTQWDQGRYYNAMCPEDENGPDGHVLTGCIATAMAQIINYWGYPLHGRGTHGYNSQYGTLEVNYDSADYDYASMPDLLTASSTPQEVDAVAQLMYHCGVAVNMGYWASESSSYDIEARAALINYFRFSPNLNYVTRSYFTNHAWHTLLRNNLAANRPIMYSGQGSGGHSFVCDGYMDGNLFHFNFGWGGYCDGWYQTSAVNPDGHDFNSAQTALVGIVPDSTGNIILGQTAGTSSFTVDGLLEFYHLLGHNTYTNTNYYNSCQNVVVFHSADTSKHLALDILSFENQNITVYDSLMGNEIAAYSAFTNTPSVNSTTNSLTLLYQGNMNYSGFHLSVSQDNGCRMVSDVSWTVDTNTIHLAWHENGSATQWQVEYGLKGFSHGEGTTVVATTDTLDITGLTSFKEYDMFVRPVCDAEAYGLWRKVTVMPEARYWTDVVTNQPEGYVVDSLGNVEISSAEGLAWFAKLSEEKAYEDDPDFFKGHTVALTSDINLSQYKWKHIYNFCGIFDGQGHRIDSMYAIEKEWYSTALFASIKSATLKNISLTNCYSKQSQYQIAAGLVATTGENVTIMNCFVSGTIESNYDYLAPIVAHADNLPLIINCASKCQLSGNGYIGGIISAGGASKVRNCYSACTFFNPRAETSYAISTGGSVENCYGSIVNSNALYLTSSSSISNSTWFYETDSGFCLVEPIYFEVDNQYHKSLINALNAGVQKYNLEDLRLWEDDTEGINDGFPLLGSEYVVTCPNIHDLNAQNIADCNGNYGVKLSWNEMGDASAWEIEYHAIDSLNSVRTLTTNNTDTLWGLTEQTKYVFRVRPICSISNYGGWSEEKSIVFDRPYWTEIVTSQPDGYMLDTEGNVSISTAEGLAWLANVVNGMNDEIGQDFKGKKVILSQDIDIGQYKWKSINGFMGSFDGKNHKISNLYIKELNDEQGLFGFVTGGVYSSIHIENAYVNGLNRIGMLIGQVKSNYNTSVINCHVSGEVYGLGDVGGMVGQGNLKLVNACSSIGTVHGHSAGGLLGSVSVQEGIRNCYSRCDVIAQFGAGGLVENTSANIENCYALGNIYNNGVLSGGVATSISHSQLKNCYVGGIVSGLGAPTCAVTQNGEPSNCGYREGTILGVSNRFSEISNCYGLVDTEHVHPLIGISEDESTPVIFDTASFSAVEHEFVLGNSIIIGQTIYSTLLEALNGWVDTYDTLGIFLHWTADTTGENGWFPKFEEVRCNTISVTVADSTPYGTSHGEGSYSDIEPTIISATPNYGYRFVQWNDGNTDNPRAVHLTQDTAFIALFEKDSFKIMGTANISIKYDFDFEDSTFDNLWHLNNCTSVNKWHINTLDSSRAIFISNDNGISNAYSPMDYWFNFSETDVFALTTLILDRGLYHYNYDWRCNGYNFLRIAMSPVSMSIIPNDWYSSWFSSVLPVGAIAIDNEGYLGGHRGEHLGGQIEWTHNHGTIDIPVAGEYYIVFYWHDNGAGGNPPAAIDNIHIDNNIAIEENMHGYVFGSDVVPYLDTVTLTAIPYEGYRFYKWTDGCTDNPRIVVADSDKFFWAMFEKCEPTIVNDSIMACSSFIWRDSVYTSSETVVDTFVTQTGCDNIVIHHIIIHQPEYNTISATACDSYTWNDSTYTSSGDYTQTFTAANGCDSTVTLHLTVHHSETTEFAETVCDSYIWNGQSYTQSGDYTRAFTAANGCDSVVTLHLTVNPTYNTPLTHSMCEGESYNFHGQNITAAGTYTHTLQTVDGCDSVLVLVVTLEALPPTAISGNTTLCQGQTTTLTATGGTSYAWSNGSANGSVTVSQSGIYTVTATNAEGCSATANVTVTVNPLPNVNISGNSSFCQGGSTTLTANGANSYVWSNSLSSPSISVSNPGTYTVTGSTANGCSAVANKVVTANPVYNITRQQSICQGQSYDFNGQTLSTAGTYTQNLSTVNGCDSIITLTLSVKELPTLSISGNTTLCQGQTTTLTATGGTSYAWSNGSANGSVTVSQSGIYTVTATNAEGCSATANVTVTVNPLPTVVVGGNSSFCQGDNVTLTATGASTYAWSNTSTNAAITVGSAGNYTVTGTDANGCSNTATKTVTVNPTYNIPLSHSICEGESYNFHGQNITAAGTYTHTLQTVDGCDSVLTLVVTLEALPPTAITGNTTICEGESTTLVANGGVSYAWSNGSTNGSVTVSQSGVYTVTATNVEGCSATANVTVNVNPLPNVNISGGNSFCQGDSTTLTAMGASTYAWSNSQAGNAITVSNAGTYTVTGTDANGCSNIATKSVSVSPTYNIPLTHSICQGESYNFFGQNITAAGAYTHTLQTVNGCDSVLTLVVTLEALPTAAITGTTTLCEGESTTLTANGGVSYSWSNGSATNSINVNQNGIYTVTATNVEGCSATANVTVTVNPLPNVSISGNNTICEGSSTTLTASGADTYSWSTGDNTASATISAFGVYTVTGTSTEGCSNTANATVLVSQAPQITISGETDLCAGESTILTANGGTTYLWSNGSTDNTLIVSTTGTWQVIGYNTAGCSSMASATVSVWQPAASEFTVSCPDSCYTWNGTEYCASGDYTQTLQTVHGCDSVVTLHLTITVGIDDHDGFDFRVYPNPTYNIVNVQITNHHSPITEIHLVDAYGRLLRSTHVVETQNFTSLQTAQIDLSRYANGVYFVKAVADGETVAVRKIVKN